MVYLCCGKIACGKSRWAEAFRKERRAVVLSCDELTIPLADILTGPVHDRVTPAVKTYLLSVARQILETGSDVILDWGFWLRKDRGQVRRFFEELGFPVCLVYFPLTREQWLKNIEDRNRRIAEGTYGAYPADQGLIEKCDSLFEAPSEDEADLIVPPADPSFSEEVV